MIDIPFEYTIGGVKLDKGFTAIFPDQYVFYMVSHAFSRIILPKLNTTFLECG